MREHAHTCSGAPEPHSTHILHTPMSEGYASTERRVGRAGAAREQRRRICVPSRAESTTRTHTHTQTQWQWHNPQHDRLPVRTQTVGHRKFIYVRPGAAKTGTAGDIVPRWSGGCTILGAFVVVARAQRMCVCACVFAHHRRRRSLTGGRSNYA